MAVLRVKEPFACDAPNGVQLVFRVGDLVSSDDPVTKGRAVFFEPAEVAASRSPVGATVEQATAAPGERRVRTRQTKETTIDG